MPELPEVETTVNGLRQRIVGLRIKDIWSNYDSKYYYGSETIKDPAYFRYFRKETVGKKIVSVERRAKSILINLTGWKKDKEDQTILIHMKMTGHLLYGLYRFNKSLSTKNDPWEPVSPESLWDPYNRRVRFVMTFDNGKQMALSDTRRFAKVALAATSSIHQSDHLVGIGPEPLDPNFTFKLFDDQLNLRPKGKIKQVLVDQTILAGIGNIYADESLWRAGIHPLSVINKIEGNERRLLFKAILKTLKGGIDFGGDSMSDYRNVNGEKGGFQERHSAYRKTGTKCVKKGCGGTIRRIVIGSRGTHFCDKHQVSYK